MTLRQLLQQVLIGLGVFSGILLISALEVAPLWVLLIVATLVWFGYIALIVRDNIRERKYPVIRYRPPESITRPKSSKPSPAIYDQEEDKV